MRAPAGRSALHQLETLRQEDAHERSRFDPHQAVDLGAVHPEALRLSRLEAHLYAVATLAIRGVEDDARHRCAASNELPLV
jgi:hypothetical protein